MSKHEHIGVAGLLHDIGKLYQRAYWSKAPAEASRLRAADNEVI